MLGFDSILYYKKNEFRIWYSVLIVLPSSGAQLKGNKRGQKFCTMHRFAHLPIQFRFIYP